jgi:hypothetical protein
MKAIKGPGLSWINPSLQENVKYCVTLALKTVIYESKFLGFQDFESLVFDAFLSKTVKMSSFLAGSIEEGRPEIRRYR